MRLFSVNLLTSEKNVLVVEVVAKIISHSRFSSLFSEMRSFPCFPVFLVRVAQDSHLAVAILAVLHFGHLKMCLPSTDLVIVQTNSMPIRPLSTTVQDVFLNFLSSFFSFSFVFSIYLYYFLPFFFCIIVGVPLLSICISSIFKHMFCCIFLYFT